MINHGRISELLIDQMTDLAKNMTSELTSDSQKPVSRWMHRETTDTVAGDKPDNSQ